MISEGSAVFELVEPTSDEGYNGGEYGVYVLRMTPAISDRGKKSLERTGLASRWMLCTLRSFLALEVRFVKLLCPPLQEEFGEPKVMIGDMYAKKLGAKHLINYRETPDWSAEVLKKATNGVGVDLVLDVVGADSIEQAVKSTRFRGVITLLGLLSEGPTMKVDIVQDLLFGAKLMRGQLGAGNKEIADESSAFLEKHQVHPQIAEVFELDQADKALEATRKLAKPGKIVMRV
ncbi:hypothetical protein B0A55_03084 [Friedmanniomyces simplex]|uniref:Alcohol dehydrogenase-like C-terminal domain-containing protein n=1 Tax=Friedmanniomyces simplex TaxID=329884 RepID=A0A4U0XGN0_9PEZI|nr:hypothetical protein B0A55_03084 [Friedmanniomyces simplex]